tara:strand:- start:143 stop:340 length:198 start_codon:yes stop_codon:yes gene_type:complete
MKRVPISSPPYKPKRDKGSDIRKAGGYRKYYESLKQFKLISNKVGRNSICPCGSNKKYKKCCINK